MASFFRAGRRRRVNPQLTLLEAQAEVTLLQAELADAQSALAEAKQRDEAEALKAAEKAKQRQALEEAKKQDAELKRRIAELEELIED